MNSAETFIILSGIYLPAMYLSVFITGDPMLLCRFGNISIAMSISYYLLVDDVIIYPQLIWLFITGLVVVIYTNPPTCYPYICNYEVQGWVINVLCPIFLRVGIVLDVLLIWWRRGLMNLLSKQ